MAICAPSILSADFSNLEKEVRDVKENGASYLHIDVMDGHFVPNISMGTLAYKSLVNKIDMVYDVHLMITDPAKYAVDFIDAGATIITFHYEAVTNHLELINFIKSKNVKVGVSIKPNTDVKVLDNLLKDIDIVLIMSVEPGFGGQKFMESSLDKIKYLDNMRKEKEYKYLIEVDGGINSETGKLCCLNGCDILVAGTYIFKAKDRKQAINSLLNL